MKALKTTLGLFLLSLFLFSIAPQQAVAANTNPIEDQIKLKSQDISYATDEITKEGGRKGDN